MSLSGSSGAYYRAAGQVDTGVNPIHRYFTRALWVRGAANPSTASASIVAGIVGGAAQNPQSQLAWDHPAGTFVQSNYNRRLDSSYDACQYGSSLSGDTWYHLACTLDDTAMVSYLNGVADGTAVTAPGLLALASIDALAAIVSAGTIDGATQFSGQIAEYALWDTPLTAREMLALGKGMRPHRVRPQNLLYYAPCLRSLGDIRRGRNMVLLGAGSTVYTDHPRVFG